MRSQLKNKRGKIYLNHGLQEAKVSMLPMSYADPLLNDSFTAGCKNHKISKLQRVLKCTTKIIIQSTNELIIVSMLDRA